jgi:predicted dehydrogenase
MKKKIAVIGFGFMGVVHAKNIIENNKLELCAIIDNRDNIFAGIEKTGNHGELGLPVDKLKQIPVYKTLEACVEKEKIDAVSICVPLFLHYELAKKALNLGLDVMLEKPFCSEINQCSDLINLVKEKDKILMVAHCVRFDPAWEFLAKCIKDKRYGELKLLSTCRSCGEPTWGIWRDEKIKKTCGGALLDLLLHDIDFANSCFGKTEDVKLNLNVDDYWEIELRYKDSPAPISIKGGFLHRHTAFASDYAVTFEQGSIRFSSLQPGIIHVGTDTGLETVEVKGDGYANELEYFAKCIEERKQPKKCLPEESRRAIEVCQKIKQLQE